MARLFLGQKEQVRVRILLFSASLNFFSKVFDSHKNHFLITTLLTMKTIVYTLSFCLVAFLFVECGSNPENATNLSDQAEDVMEAVNLSETESYYVLATSGLRMREEPSLDGEKLGVVEYGEKVQVNPLDGSKEINVSGIKGQMAKAYYKNDQGYMFTGYMSSIPVPEKGQRPADYARQLKRKGFNAKYDEVEIDDGMELEEILSIPAKNLEEAFLIGQRLNIFEMDFDLPTNSDPKSLTARVNGKKETLKLNNPTTVGAVDGEDSPDGIVYIEGYQFNIPTNESDPYWMKLIDIKFDNDDKELSEISTQVAYEGGSWMCTLMREGNFYVFRKNSVAD